MNNFLMWLGFLLVVVLAALFAVPHFVNWNGYRGVFETQASRILGRDVRVGGEVNVRFLPTPYVRFERVRISEGSEAGFGGRSFFRAENFTMWLSVPPLLQGVLEAHDVELQRPSLRLAIDEQGRGNWRTFQVQNGTLPFVPAGVSLQSVNITDGVVTFDGADGQESMRVEGINGRFSAGSLDGPYKFDGVAKWRGLLREVKLATSEASRNEPDRVPVRLQVQPQDTKNIYVVEGLLKNLLDVPEFEGGLKADIALVGNAEGEGSAKTTNASLRGRPHIKLAGKISALGTRVRMNSVVASFENVGQPQLLTGDAVMDYGQQQHLQIELISRWLDLDRLFALSPEGTDAKSPMQQVSAVVPEIASLLPEYFTTEAKLQVEQVQLGAKAVSGIGVELAQNEGVLSLKNFSAGLPGGARLKIDGQFARGEEQADRARDRQASRHVARFSGHVFVGGPSMLKTIRWATQRDENVAEFTDGAFAFGGNITLSPSEVSLTNINAEFSSRPIKGSLIWRQGEKNALDVVLEGHEVDARWFGVDEITLATVQDWLNKTTTTPVRVAAVEEGQNTEQDSTTDVTHQGKGFFQTGIGRASIKLRAGKFNNGNDVLRDVDAAMQISAGRLEISALKFRTDAGLKLQVDGQVREQKDGKDGQMNWELAADQRQSIDQLMRLLNAAPKEDKPYPLLRAAQKLTPMDLAGTVTFGRRQKGSVDFRADGLARDGRTILNAQFDAGLAKLRDAPLDVTLDIENAKISHVLSLLVGHAGNEAEALERRGKATIKAVGTLSQRLLTAAQVSAGGLSANFGGNLTFGDTEIETAEGQLDFETDDFRDVLRIAGIRLASAAERVPAAGKVTLAHDQGAWIYWPEALRVGAQTVSGTLAVIPSEGARAASVAGKLMVSQARVNDLLSPLLKAAPRQEDAAPVLVEEPKARKRSQVARRKKNARTPKPEPEVSIPLSPPVFADQPFDFANASEMSGNLDVKFGALYLSDGLVLNDAQIKLAFEPGKVAVETLTGTASGGQLEMSGVLSKARAGVTLNGDLKLENMNLADLIPSTGADQTAPVKGAMTLQVRAKGQALSPRGLITSLQGSGESQLDEIAIRGLSPSAVLSAANSALVEDADRKGAALVSRLRESFAKGEAVIPANKIPIKIVDGALRFSAFTARGEVGALRNETTIDLATLNVDSAWQVTPGTGKKARGKKKTSSASTAGQTRSVKKRAWPSVGVTFVGPLAALGRLPMQIAAGDLEREIAVRRIQKNVDELERLRREDEQRAAEERERRKQREAERAREAEREDDVQIEDLPPAQNTENFESGQAVPDAVSPSEIQTEELDPAVAQPDQEAVQRQIRRRKRRKKSNWQSDVQRNFQNQIPTPF